MPHITGIIPARYASTRFPGKPLIDIMGKSMIQRVYEQASKCASLSKVIVATDDERIASHVESFGGNVTMTRTDHVSGTDRCAEVLEKLGAGTEVVINIQGDEPFIDPEQIELLADCFENGNTAIATLIKKISSEEDIRNPNVVKAVKDIHQRAIFFSRSAIPYRRNPEAHVSYFKHIGIYGYRSETLAQITRLAPGHLEGAESLEQLRWIENGFSIMTRETEIENLSIDTPDDLKKAISFLSQ